MRYVVLLFLFLICAPPLFATDVSKSDPVSAVPVELTGGLTLEQAVSLALAKNLDLSATSLEVAAREGRLLQAGVRPNPEIDMEAANILGSRTRRNLDASENTLSVGQLIELGGKRPKRLAVAGLDRDLAKWDRESKTADVRTEVTKAFVDVLAEQERVRLSEQLVQLAERSLATVAARVKAGKVSPIDETKADAALSLSKVEMEKARRGLLAARRRLASTWGSDDATFTVAEGRLTAPATIRTLTDLSGATSGNPDVARWPVEIEQRKAALSLEQVNRIPDPTLRGGIRYFREDSARAFVAGLSIPLPVFNQNKGAIREAQSRVAKAQVERASAAIRVQTALSDAYQAMSASFAEATALSGSILPALENAYDAVLEGYRYGKFPFLEVLDAQRTLFESRARYIESLSSFNKSQADVERLTGTGRATHAGKAD